MSTTTTKPETNATSQQAKSAVSSGVDKVKDAVQSGAEKAKDLASSAAETAKQAASYGIDKAHDLANAAGQAASTAGQYASKAANTATSTVGGSMESLGHSIRENAPHEGVLGSAASKVANTLEQGGKYIREEGLGGMADDVTNAIRRNPIPSVLCALAIGFLLARATRS